MRLRLNILITGKYRNNTYHRHIDNYRNINHLYIMILKDII